MRNYPDEMKNLIIIRDGQPVEIFMGVEDVEDYWEELMIREPHFMEEIAEARQSLKEGQGMSIEELNAKYQK
jgi:hypothetical protein